MSAVEQHVISAAEVRAADAERKSLIVRIGTRFGVDPKKLLVTLKATAFRQRDGEVTDEQMMALLVVADQYKLNPFTKELYAFPDKNGGVVPVVGIDGWSRIINEHPAFDGMDFRESEEIVTPKDGKPCPTWIECTMHRKDRNHPTVIREYLDEVYREPFVTRSGATVMGPWQSHTKRFLRHKTVIQAARLAFAFVGIYDEDEAIRIVEASPIDVTPEQPSKDGKLSPVKLRKYVEGLQTAEKAGDHTALLELWSELTNDEQLFLWGELRTWERTSLKKAIDAAKAADAGVQLDKLSESNLRGCKTVDELTETMAKVTDAYAENGLEVPGDLQSLYQDLRAELRK